MVLPASLRHLLFSLFLFPALCFAGHECKIIGISDGDTITALCADNQQVKVRLAEIDAPEKAQPFGERSKQSLSDLCFDREAEINPLTTDRYGRTVARVHCEGADANAEQLRRGMAWVYDKYVTDRSLYNTQDEARVARRGLWADENPIPPWEWRHFSKLRKIAN